MNNRKTLFLIAIISLFALSCSLFGGSDAKPDQPIVEPGSLKTPEDNESPSELPTPDLVLNDKNLKVRSQDEMEIIRIPAGEFLMGDDNSAFTPEKPAHMVTLDAYWIDRYEVVNSQYRLCMEDEVCSEPKNWWNNDLNGDDLPVTVPWEDAQIYCQWIGGRLPTEAEWEKAARGTDGRLWPWGDEFVSDIANLSGDTDGYKALAPSGVMSGDVSPYGLYDTAGNAGEWVSDWFSPDYYTNSPSHNPTGPGSGTQRVHRAPIANGGGGPEKSRTVARYAGNPGWDFGIRCVMDILPDE